MTPSTIEKLTKDFQAARRVSTPLLAVTTPDPAATMDLLAQALKADEPILRWDIVRGITPGNKAGQKALKTAEIEAGPSTSNPVEAMQRFGSDPADPSNERKGLPAGTCVFMVNMHLYLKEPTVLQAVWNLRDEFKVNRRTLVMLGPVMKLPPELEHDVIVLDEPLPTAKELEETIAAQLVNVGLKALDEATMARAVDALTGLAAFTAEQVVAMSLTKAGLDVEALWERKRQAIEQTPGLSVWRDGDSLDDVAGYDNAKRWVRRLKGSKQEPRTIVFIDEIEKMFAGAAGDTSGVSQDQMGQLLSYMQDHNSSGMIFIGPPGSGKSAIAKGVGNDLGVPTISCDMGGMKGSLVGESEARVRGALKVVTAVSNDKAFFIVTCNKIASLPPELRRRFKRGTFFFDLPSKAERKMIWALYEKKYELTSEQMAEMPSDEGWTGAEIRQCAETAWDLGLTLKDAAGSVVPVAQSAKEQLADLRKQASGKFISASVDGFYVHDENAQEFAAPASRRARSIES